MRPYRFAQIVDLVDAMPFELQPATVDAMTAYSALRDRGARPKEALAAVEENIAPAIARGDSLGYSFACVRAGLREFQRCYDRAA